MQERLSAELARDNKEPLYGTIKSANVWFLLEYNGVYTNQAWEDARIPADVKAKLDSYPNSHPLLIRQPDQIKAHDRIISFFVIDAARDKPAIYHLELNSYNDILYLDIDIILAGNEIEAEDEPLYVVCTNGKRDICCAKYGVALYNAMSDKAHHQVWQSSHIGGHRFAGTMYCFPHAICYGFMNEADAPTVIDSYNDKRLLLHKLRGHAIYDKPIQVGEYFLRRELDNDKIDALKYLSHEETDSSWIILFSLADKEYEVKIAAGTPIHVLATTGDETFKEIEQYKFVGFRPL